METILNILLPGRRQRIRSEKVLQASKIAHQNSLRNLNIARYGFLLAVIWKVIGAIANVH